MTRRFWRIALVGALAALQCVAFTVVSQSARATTAAPLAASAAAAATPGGSFLKVAPVRVLDTRTGIGAPAAAIAAHASIALTLGGHNGVPSTGASSVLLTLAVSSPTSAGNVLAYQSGSSRPATSSVTFAAGQTVSNTAVVTVSSAGSVTFFNNSAGTVQLAVDLAGYYAAGAPTLAGMYGAVTPARLLDTAHGVGAPAAAIAAHSSVDVQFTGRDGIPSTAAIVLVNLGVGSPTAAGSLIAYPAGAARPDTMTVAFAAGQQASNLSAVRVSSAGKMTIYNNSAGTVHLLGDAIGYYLTSTPTDTGAFFKLASARLVDTRTGVNAPATAVASGATLTVQATGKAGVPTSGVTAVLINVNAIAPAHSGNLTVFPAGAARPPTASSAFSIGKTSANLVLSKVSTDGKISFYNNSAGTVQVAADIVGYVVHDFTWAAPSTAISPVGGVKSVSCRSTTFCVAVDADGNAVRLTGSAWAVPDAVSSAPLTSVSCSSTVFCLAVSSGGTVVSYNGTSWTAPAAIDSGHALTSVSCPSSTFCAAVDNGGGVVRYNGSGWGARSVIDSGASLVALSCTSNTYCVAVDSLGKATKFSGSSWTSPTTVSAGNAFVSISCVGTTFCMAFDNANNAFRFNGSTWGAAMAEFFNGPVSCVSSTFCLQVGGTSSATWDGSTWTYQGDFIDDFSRSADAVSCTSTTNCVATDVDLAYTYNGSAWTSKVAENVHSQMTAVSCASSTFCAATDDKSAAVYNGSTWSAPHILGQDLPSQSGFPVTYTSTSVSCPTSTFCMNTDVIDTFLVDGSTPSATKYNGSTWTASAGFDTGQGIHPTSVTCLSSTFCMAVGSEHAEGQPTLSDYALKYNGSTWTSVVLSPDNTVPRSVSCATTSFCVAVTQLGGAYRYNGSTWTAMQTIDSAHTLVSVSCPTTTFCQAVDTSGRALRFNGSTWSAASTIDAAGNLTAVSCGSSGFCVAVDAHGNAVRYNGTSWAAASSVYPGGNLTAVSCPTASFCVATETGGKVLIGTR